MKPLQYLFLTLFFSLTIFGFISTATYAVDEAFVVKLQNPIGGTAENPEGRTDIRAISGTVTKAVLGIVGSLTLVSFLYGGFTWLTSGGSADKVRSGLNAMLYSAIGLFVIFATYAIITTFISGITK
jgi:hypothetical protein